MLHRSFDDDDDLQTWLEGRPGWPLAPVSGSAAQDTLALRVVGDHTHLHAAATAQACRADEGRERGDAHAQRRAREVLAAIEAELRP